MRKVTILTRFTRDSTQPKKWARESIRPDCIICLKMCKELYTKTPRLPYLTMTNYTSCDNMRSILKFITYRNGRLSGTLNSKKLYWQKLAKCSKCSNESNNRFSPKFTALRNTPHANGIIQSTARSIMPP